jgi:hypothetical protein
MVAMRMVLRLIVCGLLLLAVASCASGVKFRHANPPLAPTNTEGGRIFFYRPSAFGAALRPDVLLNGNKVGEAISWGFFYADRPPGPYEVRTSTEVDRKVTFVLAPGQTRFVRFSTSVGFFVGHVYGELVDLEAGLSEIQDCKYTGGEPPVR